MIILGQAEADIHYGDNCLLCFCIRPVISLKKIYCINGIFVIVNFPNNQQHFLINNFINDLFLISISA